MCSHTYPHPNTRSSSTQAIISEATTLKAENSVSFNEVVKVKLVLHVNDYTDQEKEECWFTPTDYKKIRHDVITAIKPFQCNYKCSAFSTGTYTRGLERWSDMGKTTRKRRQNTLWAVLDEIY